MQLLRGLIIALSTFSQIPMPQVIWEEKGMRWALAFLPVVGVCVGALLCGWHALCTFLQAGPVFEAMGYTVIPLLVTGAIHLDGFCDTADGLASNAAPERRQEILRDSHVGAFAVIGTGIYLVAYFGLATELERSWHAVLAFAAAFVISRACAGLATLWFKASATSSLAAAMRSVPARAAATAILLFWLGAGAALLVVAGCWPGLIALLVMGVIFLLVRFWLLGQFGGFSGDLAGWLIQMLELGALAGLVFSGLLL